MNYFLLLIGSLFLLSITSCNNSSGILNGEKIVCGAEKRTSDKKKFVADNNQDIFFGGGKFQSGLEAYSGKFSAMATKKNPFVLSLAIKNTGPDMAFRVSVWRKSKSNSGLLIASDKSAKRLYQAIAEPVVVDENGWEKLELEFFTPPNFFNEDIKVYCWSNAGDTVWFDDMEVSRIQKKYPVYKEEPLVIVLDTLNYLKLINKRVKAFDAGILQSGDNDWVKGIVFGDGEMMKAKLRLKGDYLDHLMGDKWSFRIKMRKNFSWRRLRVFSIQTPFARGFLYEWFSHKLYESKDILTTRYGFVPVIMGNKSKGLYAWEEHFAKQLVESRKRREGPILKFSEDAFWQTHLVSETIGEWPDLPFYNASVIEPFSSGKTVENPALFQQFLNAQKLMAQYKRGKAKPADIFDLPKLAKYFAMLDITHARHGMAWHNQRFYYNPIICKLEPIAYDGYTEHVIIDFSINDNMAYKLLSRKSDFDESLNFYFLFEDTTFLNLYLKNLEQYSSEKFVDSINRVLKSEVVYYDSLIRMEFPYVHFNRDFLTISAKSVRAYLPRLKKFLSGDNIDKAHAKHWASEDSNMIAIKNTPEYFVTAYLERSFNDSIIIGVHSFFGRAVQIVGTGIKKKYIQSYLPEKITLQAYKGGDDGVVQLVGSDLGALYLFFQVSGSDELYSVPVNPWPYPSGITAQQELMKKIDLANCKAIDTIINNNIYFRKGLVELNAPLVIPKGYRVYFEAGTQIDLVRRASFISYSPVFMRGTKEEPVVVISSDHTGNGFTVLQAEGRSVMENVRFEEMNTLQYKGWNLTGAVTFYESDVDISEASFINNHCEDALNIVRSDFNLKDSKFDKIWGDAFDSDFSTGVVDGVLFTNIGNDAIDFSTSKIDIVNTTIRGAEDKGISGGEDSHLTVRNTIITNANIGLASKDLSTLDVFDSKVEHCKYGVVLLQKKPEYGPASMVLSKVELVDLTTDLLIEKGSKVILNNRVIKGDKKKVAEMFY